MTRAAQNDAVSRGDVALMPAVAGKLPFAPLNSLLFTESSIFSRIVQFSPYSSKITTMPLNSSISLKHLFKPLKYPVLPEKQVQKKGNGSAKCEHLERDQNTYVSFLCLCCKCCVFFFVKNFEIFAIYAIFEQFV